MAGTHKRIAVQTLTSTSSSVTFSNIPQNYTDLVICVTGGVSGTTNMWIRFNGDTATNYSATVVYATGSATAALNRNNDGNGILLDAIGPAANSLQTYNINVFNYSDSSKFKTVLHRAGLNGQEVIMASGLWRSTSPVTSFTIYSDLSRLWSVGTTFTVYGIEAYSSPKAFGGNRVYTDGSYWIHEFYNSGTLSPIVNLSNVDYLVVAGGGGGGGASISGGGRGGGGAGGLRSTVTATGGLGSLESKISLLANNTYSITVGAGGKPGSLDGTGTNGNSSSISGTGITTITSAGGGAGSGYFPTTTGNSGGSGGGGSQSGLGGAASPAGQGFAGGSGAASATTGAGGGGAGGVGSNGTGTNNGANGGPGLAVSITGGSITYAGGGGAGGYTSGTPGTGGSGGGGNGSVGANASNGTGNSGGGGGAAGGNGSTSGGHGGAGGSGIVIVRYPV